MKNSPALLCATLAFASTCSAISARADSITFSGSASGYFGATPGTETDLGLSFAGNDFTGVTSDGILSLSGTSGQLGAFTLTDASDTYSSVPFTLQITFTVPEDIMGGQSTTFVDTLIGSVGPNGAGGVFLTFPDDTSSFTFPGGAFTLTVDNEFLQPGTTVGETAGIIATETDAPEPGSLLLFGTGLIGLAGTVHRKTNR